MATSDQEVMLFPPVQIQRLPPTLLSGQDMRVYEDVRTGTTRAVYYKRIYKVSVNSELFIKHWFTIRPESFGDYWQDTVYNRFPYLLKNFIKNLIRKKMRIGEAVWVLDQFSTGGFYHCIVDICPEFG